MEPTPNVSSIDLWKKQMSDVIFSNKVLDETMNDAAFLDKKIEEASALLKNPELHKQELKEFSKKVSKELKSRSAKSGGGTIGDMQKAKEMADPIVRQNIDAAQKEVYEKMEELGNLLKPYI